MQTVIGEKRVRHDSGVETCWYGDEKDPNAPKVAIIGGIATEINSHSSWYEVLSEQGVAVLAVNALRAQTKRHPSMEDYYWCVQQVINEQMDGAPHVIGGISWGGVIAAMYANRMQPTGLALIGSAPMRLGDMAKRRASMTSETAADLLGGAPFSSDQKKAINELIELRETLHNEDPRLHNRQAEAFFRAQMPGGYRREVIRYSGPTLVMYGQHDQTIRPGAAKALIAARHRSRLPVQAATLNDGHSFTFAPQGSHGPDRLARFIRNHPNY